MERHSPEGSHCNVGCSALTFPHQSLRHKNTRKQELKNAEYFFGGLFWNQMSFISLKGFQNFFRKNKNLFSGLSNCSFNCFMFTSLHDLFRDHCLFTFVNHQEKHMIYDKLLLCKDRKERKTQQTVQSVQFLKLC